MSTLNKSILVFIIGIVPLIAGAQFSFQSVFGGAYDDNAVKITELSNGNFLFVGGTASYSSYNYIACFNKTGQMLWSKDFGYHGTGADDDVNDVIEASDGYIYVGGTVALWNEVNGAYTKFNLDGEIIYDSAYELLPHSTSVGSIRYVIDDPINKTLISIGGGSDSKSTINYPMFQKTRYTGERLYYKFIKELPRMGVMALYTSVDQLGYTLLCGGDSNNKYLVFLDTAGNFISKKLLLKAKSIDMGFVRNNLGELYFVTWSSPLNPNDPHGTFYKFSKTGDSLISKPVLGKDYGVGIFCVDSSNYILMGTALVYFNSNLDTIKTVSIVTNDSASTSLPSMAKDGSIFGCGTYRDINNTPINRTDFYIYKNYPDGTLSPQIQYMRTGLKEESTRNSNLKIYPNPANESFQIQTSLTNYTVSIYNQIGQKELEQTGATINTNALKSGMYFVEIKNKNGEVVHQQKLVVSHE